MLSQGSGLFCVDPSKRLAEEATILETHPWRTRLRAYLHEAGEFGADWVYFRLFNEAGAPRPELFIYDRQTGGLAAGGGDTTLAKLYHYLWNYGRVPLALILRPTTVDIYNLRLPPLLDEKGNPKTPSPLESLQPRRPTASHWSARARKGSSVNTSKTRAHGNVFLPANLTTEHFGKRRKIATLRSAKAH